MLNPIFDHLRSGGLLGVGVCLKTDKKIYYLQKKLFSGAGGHNAGGGGFWDPLFVHWRSEGLFFFGRKRAF